MWPFGERLRDQDALEKYRRWLRRWLLNGDGGRQRNTAPGKQLASSWPPGAFFMSNIPRSRLQQKNEGSWLYLSRVSDLQERR